MKFLPLYGLHKTTIKKLRKHNIKKTLFHYCICVKDVENSLWEIYNTYKSFLRFFFFFYFLLLCVCGIWMGLFIDKEQTTQKEKKGMYLERTLFLLLLEKF